MKKHGTVGRYLQGPDKNDEPGGCREDLCRVAYSNYRRRYREGGTNLVPVPDAIRERLVFMVSEDDKDHHLRRGWPSWTIRGLAQALEMDSETLRLIITGKTKRIRPETLVRLGVLPDLIQ